MSGLFSFDMQVTFIDILRGRILFSDFTYKSPVFLFDMNIHDSCTPFGMKDVSGTLISYEHIL